MESVILHMRGRTDITDEESCWLDGSFCHSGQHDCVCCSYYFYMKDGNPGDDFERMPPVSQKKDQETVIDKVRKTRQPAPRRPKTEQVIA